jgi:5-methylcytosine-specific restriction protein B
MAPTDKNTLWTEFLEAWPPERVRNITVEEYTNPDKDTAFIYWLEKKLDTLGSIWGGSAFKFGIYRRKDTETIAPSGGKVWGKEYAWLTKYGATEAEAFATIRDRILATIDAARAGDFAKIDDVDFSPAVKWKIAFHYQDRAHPVVFPIFKKEALFHHYKALVPTATLNATPYHEMYEKLVEANQHLGDPFAISKQLWDAFAATQGDQADVGKLLTELALVVAAYQESPVSGLIAGGKEPHYVQFRSPTWPPLLHYEFLRWSEDKHVGAELHVEDSKLAGLGPVLETAAATLPADTGQVTFRHPKRTTSRIEVRVPGGDPEAVAEAMRRLIEATRAKIDAWLSQQGIGNAKSAQSAASGHSAGGDLNLILYGPPGTGKTYTTINKALEILDPAVIAANPGTSAEARAALKQAFDKLASEGRIDFVTFHQSFSYEDFIEGLRAENDEATGELRYKFEDGVFKRLCDRASTATTVVSDAFKVGENPRIWKISIDGTGPSKTRDYCLSHGEARIGWGEVGDLRNTSIDDLDLGSNDKSSLRNFSQDMQPGDILLCIRSNTQVLAVGVVQSDYTFEAAPPAAVHELYQHVLKVQWLRKDLAFSILPLNGNTRFTLKTVYELSRFSWADLVQALEAAKQPLRVPPASGTASAKPTTLPYVLIIDEINRGNISRIFGELITLIEPSKRRGAAEALTVRLPYSKKPFSVPQNLYLIGTMNTADRSLTALDNALRRRFKFEEMPPKPELLDEVTVDGVNIGEMLRVMNQRIEVLFDRDHCLGHTYLLPLAKLENRTLEKLASIFRHEILPLLQEYFFEDWEKIAWVLNDHRKKSDKHRFVRKSEKDTVKLFGDAVKQVVDRRWTVQADAFKQIESYRYIIDASSSIADPATAAPTPAGTP